MENLISDDSIQYYIEQCEQSGDPQRKATGLLLNHLRNIYNLNDYRQLAEKYLKGDYSFFGQSGHDYKFLNLPFWLHDKTVIYLNSDIPQDKPVNILDIGSGAGHFLLVARLMGNEGHGLDIPHELYDDMFDFFGLQKTHHSIEAFTPLPSFEKKFDFVTSHYANFNSNSFVGEESIRGEIAWGIEEWLFFLNDLKDNILAPQGIVEFMLNPLENAKTGLRHADGSLLNFFENRGAQIKNRNHRIIRIENISQFDLSA